MNLKKLLFSVFLCLSAGFVGSFFTTPAIPAWYASLNKPFFNPPNWIFAPVWTTLFLLMGVSLYLVWIKNGINSKPMIIFFIQLAFNLSWSILFFALKSPISALIDIVILWGLILSTILEFLKISKPAGYLLFPYLAWVSFASVLNFSIVILN